MYATYFGFRELPFSVTPDPSFFYGNPIYQEAFSTLRHGIEARTGFIVITGEVGTGKTTLLRKLMHSLEPTVRTAFIFSTHVTFTELLRLTLNDLGLESPAEDKVTMMEQLKSYLIQEFKEGHIVALLIDEAQDLSDESLEELGLLVDMETDQEKLIQIVLMGQPELERKLNQTGLRRLKQRVALQSQLAQLNDSEVGSYINLRLQAAGYSGSELFGRDAIREIASYSRGIPRVINLICDNALLTAYATSQKTVCVEAIREVAYDMRLTLPLQTETAQAPISQVTSGEDDDGVSRATMNEIPQYEPSHPARMAVWISLLLLVFIGGTFVIYTMHAENLLTRLSLKVGPEPITEHPKVPKDDPSAISTVAEPGTVQIPAAAESVSKAGTYSQDSRASNAAKEPLAEAESVETEKISGGKISDAAKGETKIYRVKNGDHLFAILRKHFGIDGNRELRDAFNRVKKLNLRKKNWDVLSVGEEIVFPSQPGAFRLSRQ